MARSARNPHVELWQPWHEMTSREELAVKSRKAMRVAIAMHICVEVLAAIARKHILREKQILLHNMMQNYDHPQACFRGFYAWLINANRIESSTSLRVHEETWRQLQTSFTWLERSFAGVTDPLGTWACIRPWSPHESVVQITWSDVRSGYGKKTTKKKLQVHVLIGKKVSIATHDLTLIWLFDLLYIHLDRRYLTSLKGIEQLFANAEFNFEHSISYWTRLSQDAVAKSKPAQTQDKLQFFWMNLLKWKHYHLRSPLGIH